MEKENHQRNPSGQETPLSTCRDAEEQCSCGSKGNNSDWKTSPRVRVCLLLIVFLVTLIISLAAALTVVHERSRFPEPEFSQVCPDTWPGFQGKCYHFSQAEGNWSTSRERCRALGASLASISSEDELDFLLRHKGEANHWIGLERRAEGWHWVEGPVWDGRFEVRGDGPCGYLSQERISSSLCHTEKNWICSRPDNYVLWKGKSRDPRTRSFTPALRPDEGSSAQHCN